MKITNASNLPASIVKAVQRDPYDAGDSYITTTQLIDSPQIRLLWNNHRDEVTVDAMDEIWKLFGSAVHHILDQADSDHDEVVREQRLYMDVLGKKLGAKFDRIRIQPPFIMQDYKVTSVWTIIFGDRIKEWEKQLNVQAHVAIANGYKVESLEVVAILRDWRPSETKKYNDYPAGQVVVIPIPLWSAATRQQYIEGRMALHVMADEKGIADCTDEERWWNGKQQKFARCEKYCAVSRFCPQHNATL